jgi:hypothetical protein
MMGSPMSDDGLIRHPRGLHEGPASTSPYPVSRLAPPHDLVDVARQIQEADAVLGVKVSSQLEVIAEQIRNLQEKARQLLDHANESAELHRAICSFKKRIGATYHLYRRGDGRRYFSMLSPVDWGEAPHAFEGSYRLEPDMTFTRVDRP